MKDTTRIANVVKGDKVYTFRGQPCFYTLDPQAHKHLMLRRRGVWYFHYGDKIKKSLGDYESFDKNVKKGIWVRTSLDILSS